MLCLHSQEAHSGRMLELGNTWTMIKFITKHTMPSSIRVPTEWSHIAHHIYPTLNESYNLLMLKKKHFSCLFFSIFGKENMWISKVTQFLWAKVVLKEYVSKCSHINIQGEWNTQTSGLVANCGALEMAPFTGSGDYWWVLVRSLSLKSTTMC